MNQAKTVASTLIMATLFICNLAHADKLIVGVENINYLPIYQYSNGQYSGAANEILNKFATLNKHTITYKGFPITRLNKNFLKGIVDFRFPDNGYWAQDQKKGYDIKYSNPVIGYIDGVMVTPSNKGKGIDNLKRLGLVRGFTAWDYLGLIKKGSVEVRETNNLNSLIKLTTNKRNDGAYFNIDVATYFLSKMIDAPGSLVFDPELPHTKSSYSLSSFKHPKIIEQFNHFLIEQADWIKTVKEKYQVK